MTLFTRDGHSRKKMAIFASYFKEGAVHGFVHPTPWDAKDTIASIQRTISLYGLPHDILPPHSTPLIIHHASGLGDWIREIEQREGLRFKRYGSIIGWWEDPYELQIKKAFS